MSKEEKVKKVKLVIEFKTNCELYTVSIDGVPIYFPNDEATMELEEGNTYLLEWTVEGEEGCEYSLKILEPPNIGLDITRKLDSSKKDTGQYYIEIPVSSNE